MEKILKKNQIDFPSQFAHSFWRPHRKELEALNRHKYVERLTRVDQMWPWLAENYGQVIAVDAPHAAHPEHFDYKELAERISLAAGAFRAFDVKSGNVVALFAENSPRWLVVDQGLMRAGAADAVRGASAPVEELRYILEDSEASALVVQDSALLDKLDLTREHLNRYRIIVQLEGRATTQGVLEWDKFLDFGRDKDFPDPFANRELESPGSAVATILYTSGTTGKPKGVPLSHANLLHQIKSLTCVAHPHAGAAVLSVLPIWHAYERSAEYYFFSCGCTQSYSTIKHLKADLARVRPIVMATVPRLWEAIKQGFDDAIRKMSPYRQRLLKGALANSSAQRKAWRTAQDLLVDSVKPVRRIKASAEALIRWPLHQLASALLWPKVLDQLCGGQLIFPINGGGAIAPHIDNFFEAIGVEMLVGYGLTETSPVVSCRRPWRNIRGSSGPPLPETFFKILDLETGDPVRFRQKGRVFVKGPQVMDGYLGKPEASLKVLDEDGWFDTGDIGMLLPDGSLVLTGRAKDTIVLSNGENIEPGPLEEALLASPLISQIMLVGQDERQMGALVVPRVEAILPWAFEQGLILHEDLGGTPGDQRLRKLIRREINYLLCSRKGSRPEERIIDLALVDPFTIENGLLTQTLKQRRERISARDYQAISFIYQR